MKFLIGRSKHTFPALFVACLEQLVENQKESPLVNGFYEVGAKIPKLAVPAGRFET